MLNAFIKLIYEIYEEKINRSISNQLSWAAFLSCRDTTYSDRSGSFSVTYFLMSLEAHFLSASK